MDNQRIGIEAFRSGYLRGLHDLTDDWPYLFSAQDFRAGYRSGCRDRGIVLTSPETALPFNKSECFVCGSIIDHAPWGKMMCADCANAGPLTRRIAATTTA